MRVLMLALLALISFASTHKIDRQNLRLRKSNAALLKALRSLTLETERSVGQECLTEAPAPICNGDTLVTFVDGTAKSDGCMVFGRQMEDCAHGGCNAAAGRCDDVSTAGEAIACPSNIGDDWACLECHQNDGKACTAKVWGSSDRVDGKCNAIYGCVLAENWTPSRESEIAIGEWEPKYGGECEGDEAERVEISTCRNAMKKMGPMKVATCECFNCPEERTQWDMADWTVAGCCDEGTFAHWDGSCKENASTMSKIARERSVGAAREF